MRSRPSAALAGLAFVAVLALAGCSGSDSEGSTASDPAPTTGTSCTYDEDGSPAKEVDPPPASATATGQVPVTISTSAGDLQAELDADATPCTVNSFVSLAEQGYFDGTSCHRLTTSGIAVLQCGDPTGSGSGGPGYAFPDELTGKETYPAGTLAMANAGPDTNGSQFFLVFRDSQFPPNYTVFGTIDEAGLETIDAIAAEGNDGAHPAGGGAPNKDVTIEKVTVG